jgi:uncharacterized membrane protein YcgQ (UPF0703/DUF1980 family)
MEVILVQINCSLRLNQDFHKNNYIYTRTQYAKKIQLFIKLYYFITKVYDGYTHLNRNYKKFQKAAILFWSERTSKPQSHGQQLKVWEDTKHLRKRKKKKYGFTK